ncbi:hypothetical protein [uncultured Roseovarius sp.]|uniref:hypothetical protein n=1 Tax=uncultured Roseovarius sp. TaxID=293344 RepID=UPI0026102808|nr:hypothetical protein [uncultured Roseovarius sp.]
MTAIDKTDTKIIDMVICTPPQKLNAEAKLLATFGVIVWPIVASNLKLVKHNGEIKLWTSTASMRFLSDSKSRIIEAAIMTARQALDDMEDLGE